MSYFGWTAGWLNFEARKKFVQVKYCNINFGMDFCLILLQYFCETDVLRTQNKTQRLPAKR